jgi:hypothetical protein
MLLFRELPVACGFDVITARSRANMVGGFTETLRNAVEELRRAYIALQERIENAFIDQFGLTAPLVAAREAASRRALNILPFVTEPRLKAFCLRLTDLSLTDAKWIESVGSFVCMLPPTKWTDVDAERFSQELNFLAGTFKRVEAITFEKRSRSDTDLSVRVAITHLDGTEREAVIFISREQEHRVDQIAAEINEVIKDTKDVGLAGAARAFWTMLPVTSRVAE